MSFQFPKVQRFLIKRMVKRISYLLLRNFPISMQVTKESFTDDGFFKTGDAVTTDEDGYYIILGRKKLYISLCLLIKVRTFSASCSMFLMP